MQKSEYLNLLNWPTAEWDVLTADEAAPYLEVAGRVNAMYPISDPGGKKAFGKDAYVVSKKWLSENTVAAPVIPPAVPPAPPVAAPVPEAIPEPFVDTVPEKVEPPIGLTDLLGPLGKFRVAKLISIGWTNQSPEILINEEGHLITYKEIEDMSNDVWVPLSHPTAIVTKPIVPVVPVVEVVAPVVVDPWTDALRSRVEQIIALDPINKLGDDAISIVLANSTILIETVESMPDPVFQGYLRKISTPPPAYVEAVSPPVEETIKEVEAIVEAVGAPVDNVIIAEVPAATVMNPIDKLVVDAAKSVKSTKVDPVEITEADKQHEEDAQKAQALHETEMDEEALKNHLKDEEDLKEDELVLPSKDVMLEQFAIVEQMIVAGQTFQKAYYAIIKIKEALELDVAPSKKIPLIKKAVKNL
tara:strand:- start:361 stop:1608 length:1248 start_codon:yes stop_codon:yes gene_type:complete